jgi:hypothetical protein
MKKYIILLISTAIILSFPTFVFCNSGPTYWEGRPSSQVLSIDQNTPITVEREDLAFDFSVNDDPKTRELYDEGHTLCGKVIASYQMHNPTDEPLKVQMAFPFIGPLYSLSAQDILISADGQTLPYETFVGDSVGSSRSTSREDRESSFDFAKIASSITYETYKAENFKEYEMGKLYTITVSPKSEQEINYAIDFQFDPEKTKIITRGFNRFEREDNKIRNAAWCDRPTTLEFYVLGEDISFREEAFIDGALSDKTDLYTAVTATQEIGFKDYLMKYIEEIRESESNGHMDHYSTHLTETQVYNVYAKIIDQYFTQNRGYSSDPVLMADGHFDRIITLVYNVEFPPKSIKNVSVSYKTFGTMDMRETSKPMYTFDYILNPANNWSDFNNFNVEIIPPKEAPFLVKSSIGFNKDEGGVYTASLDTLPGEDLSFTLYENGKVTLLEKATGILYRSFGYLYPLVLGGIIIIIGLIVVVTGYKRLRKK